MGLEDSSAAGNASDGAAAGDPARRVLQARNSVTALFGAEKLWAAGFRGARVRMGVFDTGIRADHPHVKNIRCALAGPSADRGDSVLVTLCVPPQNVGEAKIGCAQTRFGGTACGARHLWVEHFHGRPSCGVFIN